VKLDSVTALEKRVLQTVRHARMLGPGDRVGVAVSGGADSVALLRLLLSIRGELGITLLVVHFEHGLRGHESKADARFTEALAKAQGLDFVCERTDVASAAAKHKRNLEDAARRLRYGFFERVVQEGRATRIAVAHTLDDQAETVLAHLLRGTGLTGLAGIYPSVGAIVRPLLSERRVDLREYLRALGQSWREDSTNLDERRLRARIRGRLLPLIARDFSAHVTKHLAVLASLAREEEAFWNTLVEDHLSKLVTKEEDRLSIRVQDLLSPMTLASAVVPDESEARSCRGQPMLALTERLIRRLYQQRRGNRQGLTAAHVRQVIGLAAESASGRRVELPGGIVVERIFGDLVFSRDLYAERSSRSSGAESEGWSGSYQHVITLPQRGTTSVSLPELKRRFCLKVIDWSSPERDTTSETSASALDADRLCAPLVLRNWRQGDAYRVRGHRQVQKLKTMFLERHIPRRDRASWPVLESAGRVAWVWGMAPADEFCAREGTRSGVVIEEERI
jgi:tRNA(Ile)-lysidine synthase